MPRNVSKTTSSNTRRPATRTTRSVKSSNKTVKAKATANKRRENSITSLTNGISVLRYAINNSLSVSAAAKANGYGRNYVSDIKARIEENLTSGNITKGLYTTFQSLSNRYNKASR